ncbi:MAG: hypothetical protein COB53_06255 [Elusimicrobia bacterium]|nr:MAG: hypothetical protein COB53_06255 [Elusimicrobiota bacterium]
MNIRYSLLLLLMLAMSSPSVSAQNDPLIPDPFTQLENGLKQRQNRLQHIETITDAPLPSYLSLSDDLSHFGRFADGGSDSNWYIGFNNAWIVRLPPRPAGEFSRAYIGAKIGRAKTRPKKKRPWERTVISGKVYMAVSQRPAFSSDQSFFLAETADIPLETHASIYMRGAGKSEWFWAEVPLKLISRDRNNYLIIWSPTREFRDSQRSPILAAAKSQSTNEDVSAWNNHAILGVPPRSENSALQTPINLKPALAIKLVPVNEESVTITAFETLSQESELISRFSVVGRDIENVWLEMAPDELEWTRVSSYIRHSPYALQIPRSIIPSKGAYLRAVARDAYGNEGQSASVYVLGDEN